MTRSVPLQWLAVPLGLLVALLAFLWLDHVNPPFPLLDDGVRDQLLSRDCAELGRCHMIGANASLAGFHHGPIWVQLLAAVRLLGGDTDQERALVIALMAASAATLFTVVWRWLDPAVALPAAVLFAAALGADAYPSLLINPSLAPLPNVLTAAGILCYALSGRSAFLVLAAFALGVGISAHIGAATLGVALVAVALLAGRHPRRAALAAVAVTGATYAISSTAALRANALALAEPARLAAGATAGLALVLGCRWWRPAFRRQSWHGRAIVVGLLLVGPFAVTALWLVVREQHHFSIMYLHPVLAPAAVLVASALALPCLRAGRTWPPWRWLPTALGLGVAVYVAGSAIAAGVPAALGPWTVADARAIEAHLVERGWDYESLVFRVQAPACRQLVIGLSMVAAAPVMRAPDTGYGNRQVQIVAAPAAAFPPDTGSLARVALADGRTAVVREVDSWLQPESLRACRIPGTARAPACAPAQGRILDAIGPQRFLFITRAFPAIHGLEVLPPYTARYEIPLTLGAAGTRDVAVLEPDHGACGWQITGATGVEVETPLPARRVRLRAGQAASGTLALTRVVGAEGCDAHEADTRYPPCVFEAAPGDPLLALAVAP